MSRVRTGPLAGLAGQFVLLGALSATVGLGPAGWAAGALYGLGLCLTLSAALQRAGAAGLGPADRVTLTRATLTGGVLALVVASFTGPVPVPLLVVTASVALALDYVDGRVARRTGTSSPLGARFDMEVDAFLILVLAVYVGRVEGWWVLAIGLLRYAYLAAGRALSWMQGELPPRYWRKVVAAVQGVVLAFAAADVAPRPVTVLVLAVSTGLLAESFGSCVHWLFTHRPVEPRRHVAGPVRRRPQPTGVTIR